MGTSTSYRRSVFTTFLTWYFLQNDPNLMITRGQKPNTRQRWVQLGDRKARELMFMKGYSEEVLSRLTHCNVTITLHMVTPKEFIHSVLTGYTNGNEVSYGAAVAEK